MRTFRDSGERHGRLAIPFWAAIIVLMVLPAPTVVVPLHATLTWMDEGGAAISLPSHPAPRPVPLPPTHVRPIGVTVPAVVNPTAIYHSEPAPMGIGDFGVGAGGHAYTYNTSQFLGNLSWRTLNLQKGGDAWFTDQLNVVLQFVQGGTNYAYWIQDVAFMNSSTGELDFENNIWNFTTSSYCLSSSALSGNGTVYPISGCEGYYAVDATSQPGADEFMPSPGDFSLLVRSYLSVGGLPEVAFEYWDGVTSYEVTYDNVVWPWATAVSLDRNFYVDGNTTAPSGNFYDAELSIGGPGNGAATVAQSVTNASSRLFYWNDHNFEAPRSVWNFGSDTAEAISNVQSFFSHEPDGTPLTTQLNGTSRNATPAQAYDQGRVGVLAISAPNITSGVVSVAGTPWTFQAGQASLTLVPGTYSVWVNSSSQHDDLGSCRIVGGHTTTVAIPGSCGPSVNTPTGTPTGADVGQPVQFLATLNSAGSGGDTFDWSPIAAGLNCTSSTSDSISCWPTASGTYAVTVTVTDSDGRSNTSGTLQYRVDSDPAVGTPSGSPSTVETGAAVSFTASPAGGSGNYTFAWTGLPSPCTATLSTAPVCHPATAGSYSVSVTVTDSNGFKVTSSPLDYAVEAGPVVSAPVATPPTSIDLGGQVNLSVTASGGVGSYTYTWQNLPVGCFSVDSPSFECHPTAAGTSSIRVSVTDQDGGQVTSSALAFTVNAELQILTVLASPPEIDLGGNVTFAASGVFGGTGVYTYLWSGLPAGCTTVDNLWVACQPSEKGTYAPNVTVRDSDGGDASAGTLFTVVPDPSVGSIGVSRSSVDVGQTVVYSARGVSGGVGGYGYVWVDLPTGCTSSNSTIISCIPTGPGRFPVTVTVTDAARFSGAFTLAYSVYSLPNVSVPRASTTPTFVGRAFGLTSNATSGSGNLSYVWLGLPPGCASVDGPALVCTPTTNGTFFVVVTVRDSNGGSATSAALSLVVDRPPPVSVPTAEYVLTGGLVVLVAGVAITVVLARRRNSPPSPASGSAGLRERSIGAVDPTDHRE
jgi:hypothetical protein